MIGWLLVVIGVSPSAAESGNPTNVVVFLVDDMGWADWEHDGGPDGSAFYETPNMNRLASEGVSFINAYSSASVCSPTRGALLTGKNPARTRLSNWIPGFFYTSALSDPTWTHSLRLEETTLAEALRVAGYATASIGKWHLGNMGTAAADPRNHGFDSNIAGNFRGVPNGRYFADSSGSFGLPGLTAGSSVPGDYLTDRLTDFAVDFIQAKAADGVPFFLYMSHYGVHIPLVAPPHLVAKYQEKHPLGKQSNAVYAAMLETIDDSLGRILDKLEDAGIRDETIVIFTSDNGGSLLATTNAPLREGKGLLYEGGIRVPLIVSFTGEHRNRRGSTSEAVVVTHDLYPTVLDLAGVPGDPSHNRDVDGHSLRNALEGSHSDCGATFWHYPHISPQSVGIRGGRYLSAVRRGDWKLIYFYEDESWELYNLGIDIGETTNLVQTRPDVANAMGHLLIEQLVATDAQLPIDDSTGNPVALPSPVPDENRGQMPQWGRRKYPYLESPHCVKRPEKHSERVSREF